MNRTKIDWCDYVWNPVWGCRNDCPYCYARKIARRFASNIVRKEYEFLKIPGVKEEFSTLYPGVASVLCYSREHFENALRKYLPVFLISNFKKQFPRKPSRIFVNSMSDIHFWKKEWMELVLKKIKENSQHTFIFLTKYPEVYKRYSFPENCWPGYSNEGDALYPEWSTVFNKNIKFVSLEPLLRYDSRELCLVIHTLNWIVVGFQTNPYKPAPREDVESVIRYARRYKIPIFLKDNVYRVYPDLPVLKEFPVKTNI